MTIEQIVEIPDSHRITIEVPPEIPTGAVASLEFIWPSKTQAVKTAANRTPISRYFGILSPSTYGDGVAYQRELRNEWNV
jgi:hypothetical protein